MILRNVLSQFFIVKSWNLFTLTAEADKVFCQLVMFFWMHKMKYSCHQQSSLLFMAGLFFEFLVEKCTACQSWKSDFGWHRFRFSPCWMRAEKSLRRFWPYLIAFRSCISNGKPEWLLYLMLVFLYAHEVEHSLCGKLIMHVCKIWDNDLT